MLPSRPFAGLGLLALLVCVVGGSAPSHAAQGATTVDSVGIDLAPLIDTAAHDRARFAVNITHPVSSSSQGRWSQSGNTSTWSYSARVPTPISLSFHAAHLVLPKSAVLTVSAGTTSAKYRAQDVTHDGLWSRPLIGDTM